MKTGKQFYVALFIFYFCFQISEPKTKQEVLDEKVNQLIKWTNRKSVVNLGSSKFNNFVRTRPRNYSFIVMFTAMNPQRECSVCQGANDEFTVLANSYRYSSSYRNSLFFGSVDFDEGSEVFQTLGLKSAPAFMHFPAKGKRKAADTYDIQRVGYQAETLAKWVAERTDVRVQIFRPPNYTGTVIMALVFTLGAVFLYVQRNNLDFLWNKTFWGMMAIFAILVMTSGQMWNHIRGAPYYHRNPHTGTFHYIHGSSQGQLVAETHLIMLIHAAVVVGFILLNQTETKEVDGSKRQFSVICGLLLVVFFVSLLVSIFRRKYQGYPYSFLLP